MKIDIRLGADDLKAALRTDVATALSSHPRRLRSKWFYDERGRRLFDEITRLPEYYVTRIEVEILAARAAEVAAITGATHLVDLGSGTSPKTRLLLDALPIRFCTPFDVDEAAVRSTAAELGVAYPGLEVHAIVGDFESHLGALPGAGGRLVAFLGSTLCNHEPPERAGLLHDLRSALSAGEWLLLGTDLMKAEATLVAAYDDAGGVTAEFNRNVLHVLNRQLRADFSVAAFRHRAVWMADDGWVEMRLVADGQQRVRIADLDLEVLFADGEEIRTEISAKLRREDVEAELVAAGFELVRWWTDADEHFGVSLSRCR